MGKDANIFSVCANSHVNLTVNQTYLCIKAAMPHI